MPAKISKFPIFKLSATGNDFLLVDLLSPARAKLWQKEWAKKKRSRLVAEWCDRQEGLGADGLVFLEKVSAKQKDFDFKWDFYNSDGSSAEMCGNAARAVSLFASLVLKKKKLRFLSIVGPVEASVLSSENIEVRLPPIQEERWNQTFNFLGAKLSFDFARAGVPHAVLKVPNLDDRTRLREMALAVKALPEFQAKGTNVTFTRATERFKIESVTFERGVEDFTLSCGTGAISAAHSVLRGEDGRSIEVQVPGGRLNVIWKKGSPYLRGPARIVAEMHLCR